MQDFVHLHVHTQYSLLDGQASVARLVDKAMKNGMKGIAVTDHGNMFGIKEFTNYVNKKNSGPKGEIKDLKKRIAGIEAGTVECEDKEAEVAACKAKIVEAENKLFKPIIGCEMYVARRTMDLKEGKPDQSGYHLIVLAKNEKGYHNLIKLVSHAWTRGYYMRPRTDRSELEKYHEGLIVCSACLGGEVPKRITAGQFAEAEEAIQWYKNLFGDDYYLEMQRHKATVPRANHECYPLQVNVNKYLQEYARKYNIKLICTNDVHFVDEENAEAHDRLICLSTGKDLDDPSRMLYTKQEWMKTREEMNELFADVPEALSNTLEILDKVEYYSIDHAPIMPTFAIPEDFGTEEGYRAKYTEKDLFDEFTQDENGNVVLSEEEGQAKIKRLGGYEKLYRIKLEGDYLAKLAFDGAKRIYGDPLSEEVKERLNFELYIMKTMGFPGYFLIVQDFINAARSELGVSVGPGRGSAAGSAVAYCLGITKIDPIQYDLLFERFLNPDRISLPDIDVDFDDDGRGEVLRWVTNKYGQEKVAHIITYGTMATKLAIKDVARVQKLPLSESDRLAKLVPDKIPDKKLNLRNAIEYVPELQAAEASSDPLVRDTLKYAKMLEGNVRGTGVHACGTIICRDDITDWVPVSTADDKETGEKMLVTQYEGSVIEDTGLIKMDFLGLKTLSIIKEAVENIRLSRSLEIDVDQIDITDPATGAVIVKKGQQLSSFAQLRDDGTTSCGCWIFAGSWTPEGNQMARRDNADPSGLGNTLGWAWAWPLNRRILYNRASADPQGNPWDPKRQLLKWDGTKWTGWDIPDYSAAPPGSGVGPFIMQQEGMGRLFALDKMAEGPFPEHYEPFETPLGTNPLHPNVISNPAARIFKDDAEALGKADKFPYVGTTYRLTEHFHYWTKHALLNAILQPEQFVEIGESLANKLGIAQGDTVKVSSNRGYIKAKAVVTKRIRTLKANGKDIDTIGIPIHWGYEGVAKKGFIANTLTPFVGDANTQTPEFKSFLVNVEKV